MVAGQTDLYTLNSLNSFLQKRTPIPGGLSQATVLFNSFSLSFSKALLYSLKYSNYYLISYRSLLRDLPVEGSQVNIVLAEGNQCEKESFPVDGICVCCFRHLPALPSNPLSDDALHAVLEVVLLHPLDDGVHERVHHPGVALQHKTPDKIFPDISKSVSHSPHSFVGATGSVAAACPDCGGPGCPTCSPPSRSCSPGQPSQGPPGPGGGRGGERGRQCGGRNR